MRTYTIEQIKTYLMKQDSIGDAIYKLGMIDEFLVNNEVTEIEDADELNDYLVDLESHQGEKFMYEGTTYEIAYDVTDFIRDHGNHTFCQVRLELDKLMDNGLVKEI
jgi:hypothetical protein